MIGRQPSARHHTVNVRMRLQSLSPGVQDAEKADLGTEMSWIRGYFQQGSSRGVEQESEKGFLVLPDQWRDQVRNSEDEMKIVSPATVPVGAWQATSREHRSDTSGNAGSYRSCRRSR